MGSRTWLAVALCCFIWFSYMKWFGPVPTQSNASHSVTSGEAVLPPTTAGGSSTGLFSRPIQERQSAEQKTAKMEVSLSELGGKISQVSLVDYHVTIKKDSPNITPVSPEVSAFSLGTLFTDPALQPLAAARYNQRQDGINVTYTQEVAGVAIKKEYRFTEGEYAIESVFTLSFPEGAKRDWGYLILPVGAKRVEYDANDPLHAWEVVALQNDSITRKHSEQLKDPETLMQGATNWLAFGNRYFSTVLIHQGGINPDVVLAKEQEFLGGYLRYPLQLKSDQKELKIAVKMYIGPKDYAHLSKVSGLRQLIDFGMFSFLAYPLLELLKFFYAFVHNYGVAIILLTLVVRAVFYPLSVKSFRSMKAMQKLQPQIQALKEKHKDDMQRFNQEQMALFKTHKVNPLGGCLPMLVQLPVFIALYAVLGNSIELFHAPFFGWVQDLSAKDPFYIYPALMGLAMLAQQKMTPAAGMDPTQQKVMLLMPVFFTFIMAKLPSGLTAYIFLSTILGVLQQMAINRETPKTAVVVSTPTPGGSRK